MNEAPRTPAVTRRDFLRLTAATSGAVALGGLLRPSLLLGQSAGAGSDRNLVVINLLGGLDGLFAFPLYEGPLATVVNTELRPTIFVPPAQVIPIDPQSGEPNKTGLHPAFRPLVNVAGDRIRLVTGYGIPGDPGRSHDTCQMLMSLGATRLPGGEMVGFLARLMDQQGWDTLQYWALAATNPPDINTRRKPPVSVNDLASFDYAGLNAESDADKEFAIEIQRQLVESPVPRPSLGTRYQTALATMHQTVATVRRDIARQQVGSNGAGDYAAGGIGASLKDAAKILKAKVSAPGLGLRGKDMLVLTAQGGYDTHSDEANPDPTVQNLPRTLGSLAQNLAVFVEDLRRLGIFEKTVIVVYSEFGRTSYQNGTAGTATVGTDHGHGSNTFLVGGPVRAGVVGDVPTVGELRDQDYNAQRPKVDFRDVFGDLIAWLGVDPKTIFDDPTYMRRPLGLLG